MKTRSQKFFPVFCMAFVTLLILSNISASNTFYINEYISLSAAEFLFPLTYILSDLMVELYGGKTTTKVVAMGLGFMLFSSIFLYLTTLIPSNYVEYNTVFGNISSGVVGITFASIIAFMVGTIVNATVMDKLKKRDTTGKSGKFFVRAITSSVAAELCDSLVFITLCCAFAPEFYSWTKLLSFVLTITTIKLVVEIILFPLLNWLRRLLGKKTKIENGNL